MQKKSPPKQIRQPRPQAINALLAWVKPLRDETAYARGRSVASIAFLLGLVGWIIGVSLIAKDFFKGDEFNEVEIAYNAFVILSILPTALGYFIALALFDIADCLIEQRGLRGQAQE